MVVHSCLHEGGQGLEAQVAQLLHVCVFFGLQIKCGLNFFNLDSRRVLVGAPVQHPGPLVLGAKHISNPDFGLRRILKKGGALLLSGYHV